MPGNTIVLAPEPLDLAADQKRLLAYAREHDGAFTSRAYQKLVGVDIYTASRDVKDLIRKGIVRLPKKGGRVYELIKSGTQAPLVVESMEPEIEALLKTQGFIRNEDVRQLLGLSRMQATWKLRKWVEAGLLRLEGRGRGARYYSATDSSCEGGENA